MKAVDYFLSGSLEKSSVRILGVMNSGVMMGSWLGAWRTLTGMAERPSSVSLASMAGLGLVLSALRKTIPFCLARAMTSGV